MVTEPPSPEHDKFRPHQEEANDLGQFLEWLQEQGVHLMEYGEVGVDHPCPKRDRSDMGSSYAPEPVCIEGQLYDRGFRQRENWTLVGTCTRCNGEGYWQSTKQDYRPYGKNIQEIIALYFGINKKKFDEETEAVYQVIRKLANANRQG